MEPQIHMRVMSEDWTWAQWALGAAGAVVLPLIMRRIFFHKRARISSSAGSGSLEEYMTNVRCHLHERMSSCGLTHPQCTTLLP